MITFSENDVFFVTLLVAVFAYLLVWLGALRSLFSVAGAFDDLLTNAFGQPIAQWSERYLGRRSDWAAAVLDALEAPFGDDVLSGTALFRTVIMAIGSATALFFVWCLATPNESIPLAARAPVEVIVTLVLLTVVVAAVPTYGALIETRTLLSFVQSGQAVFVYLLIDFALTMLIAGMVSWPFVLFSMESQHVSHFWLDMITPTQAEHYLVYQERAGEVLTKHICLHEDGSLAALEADAPVIGKIPLWIWTYTVFGTSAFVWVLGLLRYSTGPFLKRLPWREKPISCIAFLVSLVVTFSFLFGLPVLVSRLVRQFLTSINGG